jgi:hypothetical protein
MQIASSSREGLLHIYQHDILDKSLNLITQSSTTSDLQESIMQLSELTLSLINMEMMELAAATDGPIIRDITKASTVFLNHLARITRQNQTKIKFHALKLAGSLISTVGSLIPNDETQWMDDIRSGLKEILQNKLGDNERDVALTVSSIILQKLGPKWLIPSTTSIKLSPSVTDAQDANSSLSSGQFVTLLVHMACAEVRVRLDDETLIRPKEEQRLVTATAENEKPLEESLAALSLSKTETASLILISCLNIIEYSMAALIEALPANLSSDSAIVELPLPFEMLLSMRTAMAEAFMAIMASLVDRWEAYRESGDIQIMDNPIVGHSLRALATWLVEETEGDGDVDEIRAVIPVLIGICSLNFEVLSIVPLDLLSPAFNNITADEKTRKQFVEHNGVELLVSQLALKHVAIDDPAFLNSRVSLLGILLNIVVSDPEVVSTDKNFHVLIDVLAKNDLSGIGMYDRVCVYTMLWRLHF